MADEQMTDEQFLAEVARMESEGLKMGDIAARLGWVPSKLTYNLLRLGYKGAHRIVNVHTGETLSSRFAPSDEPETVAA